MNDVTAGNCMGDTCKDCSMMTAVMYYLNSDGPYCLEHFNRLLRPQFERAQHAEELGGQVNVLKAETKQLKAKVKALKLQLKAAWNDHS